MEKIVYILGAGFSAPLGLPVMSNFIEKSKDMYFDNPERFSYFNDIYNMIRDISYQKNFINSDLHNIEEILSILEMGRFVGDNTIDIEKYKHFLKDVISYYTPTLPLRNGKNSDTWPNFLFGIRELIGLFGYFIANLLQIKLCKVIEKGSPSDIYFYSELGNTFTKRADYGIITLNYDLVIENIIDFINSNFTLSGKLNYITTDENYNSDIDFHKLKVSKLHGCMKGDIIPPTWNKNTSNNEPILKAWKLAYEMLVNANHIRIIGYSLPISDSYIKYLLSIAFKNSKHLKHIDVITKDSDGETRERYEKMFCYPKFRFKNAKFEDFLSQAYWPDYIKPVALPNKGYLEDRNETQAIYMNSDLLESAHARFMEEKI